MFIYKHNNTPSPVQPHPSLRESFRPINGRRARIYIRNSKFAECQIVCVALFADTLGLLAKMTRAVLADTK